MQMKKRMSACTLAALLLCSSAGTVTIGQVAEAGNVQADAAAPADSNNGQETYVDINETNFPDSNLREIISRCDDDNDSRLSSAELSRITTLNISAQDKISSYKGLELLPDLEELTIYNADGEELNLGSLPSVKKVHISAPYNNNSKTKRIILGSSSVESLSVDRLYQLESVDFSGNNSLKSLYISSTKNLKEFNISGNTSLENLNLSLLENIPSIDISNTKLKSFTLTQSSCVQDINFTGCNNLEYIKLSSLSKLPPIVTASNAFTGFNDLPALKSLTFDFIYNMQGLDLTDASWINNLEDLYVGNCDNLEFVNASGFNALKEFGFSGGEKLNYVNLKGSSVESFYCSNAQFAEISDETFLGLSSLPIRYFSASCDMNHADKLNRITLNNMSRLESVSVNGYTKLTDVSISNCPSLTYADFLNTESIENLLFSGTFSKINSLRITDSTKLSNISFSSLSNLKMLLVSDLKSVNSIDLSSYKNLKRFIAEDLCNLSSFTPGKCRTLEDLRLDGCPGLSSIDITAQNSPALSKLIISGATVDSMNFDGMAALKNVYLSKMNGCNSLSFQNCSALESINITPISFDNGGYSSFRPTYDTAANTISSIDLTGCEALKSLSVHHQKLSSLDLSSVNALESLDCSGNQIKSLDLSKFTALTDVNCEECGLESLKLGNFAKYTKNFYSSGYDPSDIFYENEATITGSVTYAGELDCSGNNLTTLSIPSTSYFTYVDCSDNKLTSLGNIKFISYIEPNSFSYDYSDNRVVGGTLICSDNNITKLYSKGYSSLELFDCSNNKLSDLCKLSFIANKSREYIYDENRYEEFQLGGTLNCSNNELTYLDMTKFTNLGDANVSNNHLASLDVTKENSPILRSIDYSDQTIYADQLKCKMALSSLPGGDKADPTKIETNADSFTGAEFDGENFYTNPTNSFEYYYHTGVPLTKSNIYDPEEPIIVCSACNLVSTCSGAGSVDDENDSSNYDIMTVTVVAGSSSGEQPSYDDTGVLWSHCDLRHLDAKDASYTEEGNIDCWYCSACGRYYSDENGYEEISRETAVIPKLESTLKNKSYVSSTNITLGQKVKLTAVAEGGTEPYTYALMYKKATSSTWTKIGTKYGTEPTGSFKPGKAVPYDVKINVKDSTGKIKSKTFRINVTAPLKNTSTVSAETVKVGEKVTLSASATGGTEPYTYALMYKKSSSSTWTKIGTKYGTESTGSFKPGKAVPYDIMINVKDSTGKIKFKSFTLNVTK